MIWAPLDVDRTRNVLAFLLVAAFIAVLPVLVFKSIPAENKDVITYMVGQMSGMAITVLGFYFVNKAGQDQQDAKRAELDAQKTDNTGKLADAVIAAAQARINRPQGTDGAEAAEAERIREDGP